MVDQLLETMERVVQERKGQLIVASHAVRVWEWFARPEERIDLNPWRGSEPVSTPPKPVPPGAKGCSELGQESAFLLVEGPNDKGVYETWLKKLAAPNLFTTKVVVEAVGGKPAVIAALEWFRDHGGNPGRLFGLVDRDEWDAAAIAAHTAALPQLRVVAGRDCLESYFADPDELEPSLQAEDPGYVAAITRVASLPRSSVARPSRPLGACS